MDTICPGDVRVSLTVRVDIEDRNFHQETHRNAGADIFFSLRGLARTTPGLSLRRRLIGICVCSPSTAFFIRKPEWMHGIQHPVETSRGLA